MQKSWTDFKNLYENDQIARQIFTELVDELVSKQYPDLFAIPSASLTKTSDQENTDTQNKPVGIYLSKFFTDHLANSRKGQIRKAFNDNQDFIKSGTNVQYWLVYLPLQLKPGELSWWNSWKARVESEFAIRVLLIEGDEILKNLDDFGIYDKWINQINIPQNINFTTDTDEMAETPDTEELPETEKSIFELDDTEEIIKNDIVKIEASAPNLHMSALPEENSKGKTETEQPEKNNSNQNLKRFVKAFKNLEELYASLSETEIKSYKKRRLNSKYKDFNLESIVPNIEKMTAADLMYKARLARINENFEKALHIYEYLINTNTVPKGTEKDVEQAKQQCILNLTIKSNVIEGDLQFALKNYIPGLDNYEAALKDDSTSAEIQKKYYECFGEALLQNGLYTQAELKFEKALKIDPFNKNIKSREAIVQYINQGYNYYKKAPLKWLNPLFAPWFYYKARKLQPENTDLKQKIQTLQTRTLISFGAAVALVLGIWGITLLIDLIPEATDNKKYVQKVLEPYNYQIQKANYYYENISNTKPHYFDSAMQTYKRAAAYNPLDTFAVKRMEKVSLMKTSFIREVERNIKSDSAGYFLSMRDATEGLRLFKYMHERGNRQTGKFGYVDTLMNVVIPPVFDFNYTTMFKNGEQFKDGIAKVCIINAPGDTVYFYIDRNGKRVHF